MNLENMSKLQIKDLNKTATKAAKALFDSMYGEFNDDELEFINNVLLGVKKRSGGSVHVSFDHRVLINYKDKGDSVDDILDRIFGFFKDYKDGKIKSEPYTDEYGDEFKFNDSMKKDKISNAFQEHLDKNSKPWSDY